MTPKFTMNGDTRVQELTVENAVMKNRLEDKEREVHRLEALRDRSLDKIEHVAAEIEVLKARGSEKDKALEKLAKDQAEHFATLNNSQAVAKAALNDADLKLTRYLTKETFEAVHNDTRARLEKTELAALKMADLSIVSTSMHVRIEALETWRTQLGAVEKKTDETTKKADASSNFAWGIAGTIFGSVVVGLIMLFINRAIP